MSAAWWKIRLTARIELFEFKHIYSKQTTTYENMNNKLNPRTD